ncbi:hypothetical protein BD410DRAFT_746894 [Rickenella mellea]|uniref:SAC3/GANP/THP3 conserved domain-containing protein n=1 Tax=Rickenella mellea TaxID=50990 RepID=A0A4Y7Q732_9AGAM|nr:hypothetical protein BD410DRAFT_746894 [Rickenella mellea]
MEVKQALRAQQRPRGGGRGSIFGNKQWVSGGGTLRSESRSPAPHATSQLQRGGGRGGRGGVVNGDRAGVRERTPLEVDGMDTEGLPQPYQQANGREKTWDELVKAREAERTKAIRDGKMDDPSKPKRLDEAITIIGTCPDMCPEFERYRRERENNLDKWECVIGEDGKPTKKVDHARAVKIYERGQGDKIIPSDLRPPPILKRTLDYLFNELLPRGGFAETQAFIRDRSRAVRNDFTIQQETGPIAIECHERCTRYHILSLHLLYDVANFDRAMEIQQLMNSLLSLKEFYDDQRPTYQSANELEMRIYHRLGLIRDQRDRDDRTPQHIQSDPAFILISRFRKEVQDASAPITKASRMVVSEKAMGTFGELVGVLRERGDNIVMIYLVACFLENIFGRDTVEDMESIRGELSVQDIIDGVSRGDVDAEGEEEVQEEEEAYGASLMEGTEEEEHLELEQEEQEQEDPNDVFDDDELSAFIDEDIAADLKRTATEWLNNAFGSAPTPPPAAAAASAPKPGASVFSQLAEGSRSVFGPTSVFGTPSSSTSTSTPSPFGFGFGSPSAFAASGASGSGSGNVFGGAAFGVASSSSSSASTSNKPAGALFGTTPPAAGAAGAPGRVENVFGTAPSPFASTATATQAASKEPFASKKLSLGDQPPLGSESGDGAGTRGPDISSSPANPPPPTLNPTAPAFTPDFSKFAPPGSTSTSSLGVPSVSKPPPPPAQLPFTINNQQSIPPPIQPSTPQEKNGMKYPPLTINTNTADMNMNMTRANGHPSRPSGSGLLRKGNAIDSPVAPPPLHRAQPISLPGTPTSAIYTGPATPTVAPAPAFNLSKSFFNTDAPTPPGHLKPLFTPPHPHGLKAAAGAVREPPPPFGSPLPIPRPTVVDENKPSGSSSINGTSSSSTATIASPAKTKPEQELEAFIFERRSYLVHDCFARWKKKVLDIASWKEACRRSEAYKQKVHQDDYYLPVAKRRRVSSEAPSDSTSTSNKRRLKRKVPEYVQRTDDQLAQRFKENKEEHERRWARGSFVKGVREHLRRRYGHGHQRDTHPLNWGVWLCMNPDNDRTAIWLEQKFDVPESGDWESEAVFSIPLVPNAKGEKRYPGLVVFECLPLEDVKDDLERKYCVLDDCSRLRDIISTLPTGRHYRPSLLILNWADSIQTEAPQEIVEMANKFQSNEVIESHHTFSITSIEVDLDVEFTEALQSLDFDLEGRLVEWLTLPGLFGRFSDVWSRTGSIWTQTCGTGDQFNWPLFGHICQSLFNSMDILTSEVMGIWDPAHSPVPLSCPIVGGLRDATSIQSTLRGWMRSEQMRNGSFTDPFAEDEPPEDFSQVFMDYVRDAALSHNAEYQSGKHAVPKATLSEALTRFESTLEAMSTNLQSVARSLPRIPKRRPPESPDTLFGSRNPSPTPSPWHSPKRLKLNPSGSSDDGEPPSPSPSATSVAPSMADSTGTGVTLAMLRALSKDVLKNYGKK